MEEEDRGRVWWLYGWFSALIACGSCVGTVAWSANMMILVNYSEVIDGPDKVQKASLFESSYRWITVFLVTYAIEFLCLSAAKLMVLDRMSAFAAPQSTRLLRWWTAAGRTVMMVVV